MRLANFNIRATPPMRNRRVRSDLRAARRTRASIVTWQELAKLRRYRRLLQEAFPARQGWVHFHLKRRNAISVDTDTYQVLRHRSHRLTKGRLLLPQPSRYTNEVVVRHRDTLREWAVLDSHFDNGGYNGRWRPRWNRRARRRRWNRQFARTKQLVHDLHAQGLEVVGSGDYNRRDMPRFHPDQQWVMHDGVMWMWVLPAAGAETRGFAKEWVGTQELYTDHAGLAATLL